MNAPFLRVCLGLGYLAKSKHPTPSKLLGGHGRREKFYFFFLFPPFGRFWGKIENLSPKTPSVRACLNLA